MDENEQNRVKTTQTAFRILEQIQDQDGIGITELSWNVNVSKSTVHRHITTLLDEGYIIKEKNEFYLGLKFLDLGESARMRDSAYRMAGEKVKELAEETEERAQFIVEEHGFAVYIYREIGKRAVQTDPGIGKRIPLHATSAGKAILAFSSQEKVEEILANRGLPSLTEATIVQEDELLTELEEIRSRGYAFNKQENISGLNAVGVPIIGPDKEVIGALSVSGPSHRLTRDQLTKEIPRLLLGTANELELNIAHS